MRKLNLFQIWSIALLFGLSACNLPSTKPGLSIESQAGTLAAQTIAAIQTQMPTQTLVPANTPTMALQPKTSTSLPSSTATELPPHPLNPPSLANYDFSCAWNGSGVELTIIIEWTDKSDNETGFVVFRDDEEISNLLPNSVQYTDIFAVSSGQKVDYAISAYNNESGKSEAFTVSATCE